jgi:TonB family protein
MQNHNVSSIPFGDMHPNAGPGRAVRWGFCVNLSGEFSGCRTMTTFSHSGNMASLRRMLLGWRVPLACLPLLAPLCASPQADTDDVRMRGCVTALSQNLERRLTEKDYPVALQNSGTQGTVLVQLTLDRSGRLRESALAQSSGAPALDQAALRAVQRVYPRAAAAPAECQLSTEVLITLPIRFELRRP